jgi:hypothetical protein
VGGNWQQLDGCVRTSERRSMVECWTNAVWQDSEILCSCLNQLAGQDESEGLEERPEHREGERERREGELGAGLGVGSVTSHARSG